MNGERPSASSPMGNPEASHARTQWRGALGSEFLARRIDLEPRYAVALTGAPSGTTGRRARSSATSATTARTAAV